MSVKYIFITGGVLSALGKGLTSASIGQLLEKHGYKVALAKFDPYLNVDPGTMNPFEHGEVYVTSDGVETDLDLGHYHRFTHSPLSKASSATTGQIYDTVLRNEREGKYLGKTVQVIPHVTNEIKRRILATAKQEKGIQIVLVEIGGTVGDIESLPFLEAIRQFRNQYEEDCLNLHLTYVPYLKAAGEIKTKPTQHSVQALREIGIFPDFILCRSENSLNKTTKDKISLFCNVAKDAVIDEKDVEHTIYEVPLDLHRQKLDQKILTSLGLNSKKIDLSQWKKMLKTKISPTHQVAIGIVGKYLEHSDAYKSVFEALDHGGISCKTHVEIKPIESDKIRNMEHFEKLAAECDGILVPGGFGQRGLKGKLLAAQYCRETGIPYFGICLGMQIMAVEFARNVLGLEKASSTEMHPKTPDPIISLLSEQRKIKNLGGTMRLGAYPCKIQKGTKAYKAYKKTEISERHRHRYEFNNKYRELFEENGFIFSGIYTKKNLIEIAEIADHPWMVAAQFHPEFQSRPLDPNPLFKSFIEAVLLEQKKG